VTFDPHRHQPIDRESGKVIVMMRILNRTTPTQPSKPGLTDWKLEQRFTCTACGAHLAGRPRYARHRICDECGHYSQLPSALRIASLVDSGSFQETEAKLSSSDPIKFTGDEPYSNQLQVAQIATGQSDAIVTGRASIHGHEVTLAVLDFAFLGGSMGVVVGEKFVRATELSLREDRPLITVVASGGARMQEGMLSLLQMAKTASAVQQFRKSVLPYISVLTHPTTGGVFASFSSLGDIVVAEPKSLIGFAGPRVAEQFLGKPLPPGSHTAEFLLAHGMIDAVIERSSLRRFVADSLDVLNGGTQRGKWAESDEHASPKIHGSAWDSVLAARDPERPTSRDYISLLSDHFIELHGDRESGDDPAIVAGLALIDDRPVAIVGIDRGHGVEIERTRGGRPLPEGYRKAQRIMGMAGRFGVPVVTLIDTPGAYPGIESEERGLAREIAESMALMSDLPTPIVTAITGEGGSGGALALAVADRVLIQERAIYSVIAPEGAAAILYRDASRASEVAEQLRLTASDIVAAGIADEIVSEPEGGAAADPERAAVLLKESILSALHELLAIRPDRLLESRFARYRSIGSLFVKSRSD